jgi:alpha-1,6-mannosyltransferase
MPPEPTTALAPPHAAAAPPILQHPHRTRRLTIADVAMFYGERGGGIHTYLEAKASFAARTGAYDHHLIVPGRPITQPRRAPNPNRHEQPSLRLAASNGYRLPLGSTGLLETLRELEPDVVLLHDPYWTPRATSRVAHEVGATVIAVHHSSAALNAGSIPGPHGVYTRALRRWYRRAYVEVDAVMSCVDSDIDSRRPSTLPLRLGLDPAFRPFANSSRDDHVLYVGRLSREKGLRELLEAAAAAPDQWPLVLVGTGPAGDMLRERTRALKLEARIRFEPFIDDRMRLALEYARARCVVLPGPHETFGLVALEAAACGATVVTASATPSAALLGDRVETFEAHDARGLARAIDRARRKAPNPAAAAALAQRHSWDAALTAELTDLQRMVSAR